MADEKIYPIDRALASDAHIDEKGYVAMYEASMEDRNSFWAEQADKFLTWDEPWETVSSFDFNRAEINWFDGGVINASYNCVDRHLEDKADQVAILWEGDEPNEDRQLTYKELHSQVCRFSNAMKSRGIKKGDRVSIYMPMVPEAAVAMLACARIGAVHSVVFGGFSPDSLKDRILDSQCTALITADEGVRGGKTVPLKQNADEALENCPEVRSVFVLKRTGGKIGWVDGRDIWYHDCLEAADSHCPPERCSAEDPLFILYTSGSTGKPKGVLHTTGGYMLHAAMSHHYVFDYKPGDIYWCTADVGWVTGHSYIVYGPLANGATTVMFEGLPNYPTAARMWQVVEKHKVNSFYTAPTALRALMGQGDNFVKSCNRTTLRILGTVGEPINPEAWEWYYRVVGESRCPVVDTWWQTETGGIMITPLPGARALKPGSATLPFFGVEAALLDEQGREIEGEGTGSLVIKSSWPGQMRTVYGDHKRFKETYFSAFPGYYFTGDGARRDRDGYYWITGRVDDVINVSGHRLGTAEVESALVLHDTVSEAAVVGYPHDIKGQGIYAYVTLMNGIRPSEELRQELINLVRKEIGSIASPDRIQWAPGLPKTRSGKIMRRILRKIAGNELENLGDTTTLADPSVVDELIKSFKEIS